MKRITTVLILGLTSLFITPYLAVAQSPETTASEVVDRETLKAFVEGVKAQMESITDPSEQTSFLRGLATESREQGTPNLIIITPQGKTAFHADDAYAQGLNLLGMKDDRGNNTMQALFESAETGGGFVEYYWDDPAQEGDEDTPKIAYASGYTSQIEITYGSIYSNQPVVLIGGYHHPIAPIPQVTAAEVVGRETLKAFVHSVLESFLGAAEQIGLEQFHLYADIFRVEGSPWKQGSVYFFVFTTDGFVLFHGVNQSLEFTMADLDRVDVNGVMYIREIIRVAKEGGFAQYHYDDPSINGDENTGSPKVTYAELVTHQDQEIVIGAGFYTGVLIPTEETITHTEVEGTVLGGGGAPLGIEFSRSIAGIQADYLYKTITTPTGYFSLTISSTKNVSGYYKARAIKGVEVENEIVGQWHSIPLNRNQHQVLELTLGGDVRVVRAEPLVAAKPVLVAETEVAVSGLEPNVPNPFNSTTLITYHLSSPGPVQLVIYNVLGQPVRTLVNESQAAGSYQIQWDVLDQQGVSLSTGIYIARLSYPSGVQTQRLLYLK